MNRIRELRKREKMTQKELADRMQIADSTLSYWEMGKYEPDNEALIKLSRFFHVPIDYIIGGDFTKWEIAGDKVLYSNTDRPISADSTNYVCEPIVAYETNDDIRSSLVAFYRNEFSGLTQDEIEKLAEYAEFLKMLRDKRKDN